MGSAAGSVATLGKDQRYEIRSSRAEQQHNGRDRRVYPTN